MAEDDLVLLDLCSSSFGSGHSDPLYKGRAKVQSADRTSGVCSGVSGKHVWIAPWQISALLVIYLRRLLYAHDPQRGRAAGAALC